MTSLWSNVFLGSLGGMIIYFAGGYILFTTHGLSDTLRAEIQGAMPWIAPILPLSMASGISIGALKSRERFFASNVIQILSNMLGQILPLLTALFISPSLTTVIPAILAVRALTAIATLMFVVVSEQLHRFTLFDLRRAKSLFQFGIWVALTNIISPLMGSIGQFVIANMMGPSFVARFAVPMTAAMRLQIFNAALGRTVFPRFSRFDREEASALAVKSSVAIAYLSAMLFAPGLVVVHPFFDFWMGKNFAIDAAPVASVLFIGAWFNGLAFIPEMLLLGQKHPDQLAKLHVAEILPYIGALWFLIHQLGLTGAAVAWTLRAFVDALVLFRLAHLPMRGLLPAVPALVGTIVGLVFGFVDSRMATGRNFGVRKRPCLEYWSIRIIHCSRVKKDFFKYLENITSEKSRHERAKCKEIGSAIQPSGIRYSGCTLLSTLEEYESFIGAVHCRRILVRGL